MPHASFSEQGLKKILRQVSSGKICPKGAYERLKNLPYEALGFARVDHHRPLRKKLPEAIYAPGKSREQIRKILKSHLAAGEPLLLTRLDEGVYGDLRKEFPGLCYSPEARLAYQNGRKIRKKDAPVAVITAGTSDIPVAEEAAVTLEVMGKNVVRIYDCGVAGLHRLVDKLPELARAKAVICVAGMEGALPSVVAGLVSAPVIAVPTSIGYGASFEGLSALLSMLNSCAQGVAVMNIDNGFGAACFTALLP